MPDKKTSKSCFVIAPIGEPGSETRLRSDDLLELVIVPVTKELGYSARRADQMTEPGLITRQVVKAIMESHLVLADLSDRNANVFYELSLRHAIGKPVVHLIQESDDIPFDVRDFRTVRYNIHKWASLDLTKNELREHIRATEELDYAPVSPISAAVDLAEALTSKPPQDEKGYAPLLERIMDELSLARRSLIRVERVIGSESAPLVSYPSTSGEAEDMVMEALARRLSPHERKVVELLYGLEDGQPLSLDRVAMEFNMTSRHIARVRRAALTKLADLGVFTVFTAALARSSPPFSEGLARLFEAIKRSGGPVTTEGGLKIG